jgi:hypothetical protein
MVGFCEEESWLEDEGRTAFVVYGVHPVRGDASQVGFVVDLRLGVVRSARLLISVPDGIQSEPVEMLPLCPELGQPYRGPGSESYRRPMPGELEGGGHTH